MLFSWSNIAIWLRHVNIFIEISIEKGCNNVHKHVILNSVCQEGLNRWKVHNGRECLIIIKARYLRIARLDLNRSIVPSLLYFTLKTHFDPTIFLPGGGSTSSHTSFFESNLNSASAASFHSFEWSLDSHSRLLNLTGKTGDMTDSTVAVFVNPKPNDWPVSSR